MKTKILKMILPAVVFMLAVVSAFAFKNVERKALLAPEPGWVNLPGNPCSIEVMCDDDPTLSQVCTAIINGIEYQAFGKSSSSPNCIRVLYKPLSD